MSLLVTEQQSGCSKCDGTFIMGRSRIRERNFAGNVFISNGSVIPVQLKLLETLKVEKEYESGEFISGGDVFLGSETVIKTKLEASGNVSIGENSKNNERSYIKRMILGANSDAKVSRQRKRYNRPQLQCK